MKVWVYLDDRQQGPFEIEELKTMPGFNENTRVWFEGLPKWYPAGSLDELRPLFSADEADAQAAAEPQESPAEVAEHIEAQAENTASRFAPGQIYTASRPLDKPCPPTYIGWSIFLLICCCSPVSAASLIASICVSTFYNRGDMDKARKASEVAAWLVMVAFALGILPVMLMSAMFD